MRLFLFALAHSPSLSARGRPHGQGERLSVPLIPRLDLASKNETHSCCLFRGYCAARVSSLALFFFVFFHHPGPLLASVGTPRRTPLICPPGRRPRKVLSAEEIKARFGSRVLLLVVPTAWVRLGAQPDGPIPRFALIIPDPDDLPPWGQRGGPRNHFPKVPGGPDSLTRAVQYVKSCPRADHAPTFSEPWTSATNHHDSWCPRPASKHGRKAPQRGPVFKLYSSTAILRCSVLWETIW